MDPGESPKERPAPFHHVVDGGAWFAFAGIQNTTKVDDLDEQITTVTIVRTSPQGAPALLTR